MEVINQYSNMGTEVVEIKTKHEGTVLYVRVDLMMVNLNWKIKMIGVAKTKALNYKFVGGTGLGLAISRGDERKIREREMMLELVPAEVLLFALNYIKDSITIEDDWLK